MDRQSQHEHHYILVYLGSAITVHTPQGWSKRFLPALEYSYKVEIEDFSQNRKVHIMSLTPYAAAKIVNAVCSKHDLKNVPTQMMYNYTTARLNAKKASFIEVDKDGRITESGLNTWMTKYFAKKGIEVVADDLVKVGK